MKERTQVVHNQFGGAPCKQVYFDGKTSPNSGNISRCRHPTPQAFWNMSNAAFPKSKQAFDPNRSKPPINKLHRCIHSSAVQISIFFIILFKGTAPVSCHFSLSAPCVLPARSGRLVPLIAVSNGDILARADKMRSVGPGSDSPIILHRGKTFRTGGSHRGSGDENLSSNLASFDLKL